MYAYFFFKIYKRRKQVGLIGQTERKMTNEKTLSNPQSGNMKDQIY